MPKQSIVELEATDNDIADFNDESTALDTLEISPRLVTLLDTWSQLPPHVQETITLLSELKVSTVDVSVGQNVNARQSHVDIARRLQNLRRELLRVLRHCPERYGIDMDSDGWVAVDQVLAFSERYLCNAAELGIASIVKPLGDRVQIKNDLMRASYGHSSACFNPLNPAIPDVPLFHGTSLGHWPMIELFGLQPINRRFVQLTCDYDYAHEVACSHQAEPLVLQVTSRAALEEGVDFYETGTHVWLATHVPAVFLQIWGTSRTYDIVNQPFDWDLAE